MLKNIAQSTQVPPVRLAKKGLSKMVTMGVNSAFHVNIVIQVHLNFFSSLFHKPLDIITNIRVQYPDDSDTLTCHLNKTMNSMGRA